MPSTSSSKRPPASLARYFPLPGEDERVRFTTLESRSESGRFSLSSCGEFVTSNQTRLEAAHRRASCVSDDRLAAADRLTGELFVRYGLTESAWRENRQIHFKRPQTTWLMMYERTHVRTNIWFNDVTPSHQSPAYRTLLTPACYSISGRRFRFAVGFSPAITLPSALSCFC